MTYFETPVFTFEADREIPTLHGTRRAAAWWAMVTCPNCPADILLVHSGGPFRRIAKEPVEATVRAVAGVGRSAADVMALYRAHGGAREIAYVLDLDPLPAGPVQKLIPLCVASDILDPRCAPVMWLLADGRAHPTSDEKDVHEGWLGTSADPRLRLAPLGAPRLGASTAPARTLRFDPPPPRPLGSASRGSGVRSRRRAPRRRRQADPAAWSSAASSAAARLVEVDEAVRRGVVRRHRRARPRARAGSCSRAACRARRPTGRSC